MQFDISLISVLSQLVRLKVEYSGYHPNCVELSTELYQKATEELGGNYYFDLVVNGYQYGVQIVETYNPSVVIAMT